MKNVWNAGLVTLVFITAAHANNDANLLNSFSDVAKSLPAAAQQSVSTHVAALDTLKEKNQIQAKELHQLRVQLANEQQASRQQAKIQREQRQQIAQLQEAAKKISATRDAPAKEITGNKPQGDAERDSYTLGQFFASNSEPMMKILAAADVKLNPDRLAAGFSARIQQQPSLVPEGEMANRYGEMQQSMQQGMEKLIGQSQQKITQQIGKRTLLKTERGVSWLMVKKANAALVADQTVAVQVKVTTLDGKVINDFSDQAVPFSASVPPLMYEGMALSGKGGAVEGWALAKDIANREPLPAWVAPYEVVHYQLALK